jgi:apolipoprotein N-acyltransferase
LKDLKIHKKLFQKNFSDKHLIILGINEIVYEDEEFSVYNTLSILNRNLDVQETYFKNNLVPFGEFLPLESLLTKIGLKTISIGYQSFSKGKVRKPININNEYFDLSFLPLICYEIIYSGYLSDSSDYDLIINISEDGWFGNSIGPSQHFSHSIFRSIEEGKNIIRSTNNGISGHINPRGELNGYIESTQGSVIEVTGYKNSKKTLFSKYQHKMFFYLLIFYISFIFFINRGRKRI